MLSETWSHRASTELLGKVCYRNPRISSRSVDVWALGVVLFNIVTGDHPWVQAGFDDEDYNKFCASRSTYLTRLFDISPEANNIFQTIFARSADHRITLPALRDRILAVKTFGSGRPKSEDGAIMPICFSAFSSIPSVDMQVDSDSDKNTYLPPVECDVLMVSSESVSAMSIPPSDSDSGSNTTGTAKRVHPGLTLTIPLPHKKSSPIRIPRRKHVSGTFALPDLDRAPKTRSSSSETSTNSPADTEGPETPEMRPADASVVVAAKIDELDLESCGLPCEDMRKTNLLRNFKAAMQIPGNFEESQAIMWYP